MAIPLSFVPPVRGQKQAACPSLLATNKQQIQQTEERRDRRRRRRRRGDSRRRGISVSMPYPHIGEAKETKKGRIEDRWSTDSSIPALPCCQTRARGKGRANERERPPFEEETLVNLCLRTRPRDEMEEEMKGNETSFDFRPPARTHGRRAWVCRCCCCPSLTEPTNPPDFDPQINLSSLI